jgi:hypothetical protein
MLMPVETMQGEDEEDTQLLKGMAERARDYVTSFHWCPPIEQAYLAFGIGKIIALFLFTFDEKIQDIDDKTWVIEGDLPPAFIPCDPGDSARSIIEHYCELMDDWVTVVRSGGNFENVFPVSAARTEEHADMLASRLEFLRQEIIPEVPADVLVNSAGEIVKQRLCAH